MSARLRKAGISDAAALAGLHATGFLHGWPADDFAAWLGRAEAFAIIAESAEGPAAFGLACAAGEDAELLTLATAPVVRRAGLGRRVLRELDAEAVARGLTRWVLEVADSNLAGLGLYRSEGFVEIGRRSNYYRQAEGMADAIVLARPAGFAGGHGLA